MLRSIIRAGASLVSMLLLTVPSFACEGSMEGNYWTAFFTPNNGSQPFYCEYMLFTATSTGYTSDGGNCEIVNNSLTNVTLTCMDSIDSANYYWGTVSLGTDGGFPVTFDIDGVLNQNSNLFVAVGGNNPYYTIQFVMSP